MLCVLIVQIGRTTDGSLLAWPGFRTVRDLLFETRFGQCWLAFRARNDIASSCLGIICSTGRVQQPLTLNPVPWIAGSVVGAIALLTLPLSGHAAAVENVWAAVASDWVHLTAVAVSLGGLVYLIPSMFALGKIDTAESTLSAASLARRFSATALVALAVVIGSGLLNALRRIRAAQPDLRKVRGHPDRQAPNRRSGAHRGRSQFACHGSAHQTID